MKSFKELLENKTESQINIIGAYSKQNEKLHQSLSDHYDIPNFYQKNKHNLSHEEYRGIDEYTNSSFGLNDYHWNKHKGLKNPIDHMEERTNHLDSVLSKMKTPHALRVWSGVKYDPRDHMNSEGIVHHPAYLSTSTRFGIAARFGHSLGDFQKKNILNIHIPKDHPGAYVAGGPGLITEREFILPRGINLKHIKTTEFHSKDDPYKDNNEKTSHYHIHHMEIVK